MEIADRQGRNRELGVPIRLTFESAALRNPTQIARLRAAFSKHFELVWRTLLRFGVPSAAVDDAAQHVFLTLAAELDQVSPNRERAFLVGVACGVAANARRRDRRLRDHELHEDAERADESGLTPEELLEWKQRRSILDLALNALSLEQRTVFVLFELEGFSLPEIAESLRIPLGTATSRLRRARAAFEEWVSVNHPGGCP
jgi:RNA polymerase sigma-70 factor (ECF subfamily)